MERDGVFQWGCHQAFVFSGVLHSCWCRSNKIRGPRILCTGFIRLEKNNSSVLNPQIDHPPKRIEQVTMFANTQAPAVKNMVRCTAYNLDHKCCDTITFAPSCPSILRSNSCLWVGVQKVTGKSNIKGRAEERNIINSLHAISVLF